MKKNSYGKILKDGIITQNPVLVQVLGMCPTLAVSTRLMNGLGMGVAVTVVLIFSNLFISLLRKVIDKRIRIASFIVIIAGFVTMVEMVMKAYLPSLSESLGVYIPLIVVNCIILARAEAFASRNKPLPSVVDGIASGIGFTVAICIVSAIREVLGTGALLGYDFKTIPPIMIFTLAPGGLLVLGFVMAFCAWVANRRKE
ncbi:MAG: electron transport complex subunit E, partial [Clostridia bacterium]|nr:electron transport complex subunit E [Clostridia bacterium]